MVLYYCLGRRTMSTASVGLRVVPGRPGRLPRRSVRVAASHGDREVVERREVVFVIAGGMATAAVAAPPAEALGFKKDLNKRQKIPESEYSDGPQGLRYYDVSTGNGRLVVPGDRVAVHYEAKWKGITFMTSRQGLGVTGGIPLGFDVGQPAGSPGSTLTGLDLGVRGMREGGQRKLIVPPELAYGSRGFAEVPPNATLDIDVEVLSIKKTGFGTPSKPAEG